MYQATTALLSELFSERGQELSEGAADPHELKVLVGTFMFALQSTFAFEEPFRFTFRFSDKAGPFAFLDDEDDKDEDEVASGNASRACLCC